MNDLEYLKMAVEQAKESVEKGGFPAGAILVKNNEIIANGGKNPTNIRRTNAPPRQINVASSFTSI